MRAWTTMLLSLAGLTACSDTLYVNVIDYRAIAAVQTNIKHQLGLYYAIAARFPPTVVDHDGKVINLRDRDSDFACGRGSIDFDILSVKVDLTTSLELNGSAKIVVAPPFTGGSAGPSVGGSKDTLNSQEMVYNLWPALMNSAGPDVINQPIPKDLVHDAPIAAALISLRNGLIAAARTVDPISKINNGPQPCFADYNTDAKKPGGDPGDSFKLGLVVTGDLNVGFEVKLTAIDATAGLDRKSISGNSITVNFVQHGTYDIPTTSTPARGVKPGRPRPRPVQVGTNVAQPAPATVDDVCKLYGEDKWQCVIERQHPGEGEVLMMRPNSVLLPRLDDK